MGILYNNLILILDEKDKIIISPGRDQWIHENFFKLKVPDGRNIVIGQPGSYNSDTSLIHVLWPSPESGGEFEKSHTIVKKMDNPKWTILIGGACSYIEDWKWYIGAGMYQSQIDDLIAQKRSEFFEDAKQNIFNIGLLILLLMAATVVVSYGISQKHGASFRAFENFFKDAAQKATCIDIDKMNFVEFQHLAQLANTMIEKRTAAENELHESQQRFRRLVNQATSLEEIREFWRQDILPSDKSLLFESVHKRKDGTIFPVEIRAGKILIKEGTCILGLARDITERKQAEREKEHLLQTLKVKNDELQSIVYVSSHDLRAPLVNIQGFSGELGINCKRIGELLTNEKINKESCDELNQIIDTEIPQALKFIKSSVNKMDQLLKGLLQVSRIGSAEINIEVLDMNHLIDQVKNTLGYKIQEHNASFNVDKLPKCLGDKNLVNQIFTNLIDNAVKYKSPSRPLEINIKAQQDLKYTTYSVSDNGLGIEPNHLPKIFEIFHQLNPSGKAGGEGLGLTIVKRIIDRLGGKIDVESVPDEGTTFYISLPSLDAD